MGIRERAGRRCARACRRSPGPTWAAGRRCRVRGTSSAVSAAGSRRRSARTMVGKEKAGLSRASMGRAWQPAGDAPSDAEATARRRGAHGGQGWGRVIGRDLAVARVHQPIRPLDRIMGVSSRPIGVSCAGWPRAGNRPRLPQIRTCPTQASGSSICGFAAMPMSLSCVVAFRWPSRPC